MNNVKEKSNINTTTVFWQNEEYESKSPLYGRIHSTIKGRNFSEELFEKWSAYKT